MSRRNSTGDGGGGGWFGGLFGGSPKAKAAPSVGQLAALHALLTKHAAAGVGERNREAVIEALRNLSEVVIWGDRNDPAVFELFVEKNVLANLWRIMYQKEPSPLGVQQQLLQTLSILIQNIEAGPSVFYILSNNHINELITHPFDLSNEELLAHYVSLLKAIALRLDEQTVQFFIGKADQFQQAAAADSGGGAASMPPPPLPVSREASRGVTRFALFDEALKLWANEERMVRLAVRTIVLSISKVNDAEVRSFCSRSPLLPKQLNASLRADCAALLAQLRAAAAADAPTPLLLSAVPRDRSLLMISASFTYDGGRFPCRARARCSGCWTRSTSSTTCSRPASSRSPRGFWWRRSRSSPSRCSSPRSRACRWAALAPPPSARARRPRRCPRRGRTARRRRATTPRCLGCWRSPCSPT